MRNSKEVLKTARNLIKPCRQSGIAGIESELKLAYCEFVPFLQFPNKRGFPFASTICSNRNLRIDFVLGLDFEILIRWLKNPDGAMPLYFADQSIAIPVDEDSRVGINSDNG